MTPRFQINEVVYLRSDSRAVRRLVTGYTVRSSVITYELASGTESSWHYEIEITSDPEDNIFNTVKSIGLCQPEKKPAN